MTVRMPHKLAFGGETVDFSIERTKRRKTVAISVGYDGVRVLSPSGLDDDRILAIIRKKGPWILRKQTRYRELGGVPINREFVSGETFHYLGRPYRLKVAMNAGALRTRVVARGFSLIAEIPTGVSAPTRKAAIRNGLRRWYREHAKFHFQSRTTTMATSLGVPAPKICVVDQLKRWGSCDSHARIRLNWRLVMAPMSLVDYVIAHETCHLLERNHSRRFWRSLEILMPDYETRVRQLNQLGHLFVC